MVKITETEITDIDGSIKKIKTIESPYARVEHTDGTVAEYSDCTARQWPWPKNENRPEWELFGIPVTLLFQAAIKSICLLSDNHQVILRLMEITPAVRFSQASEDGLRGVEVPTENL